MNKINCFIQFCKTNRAKKLLYYIVGACLLFWLCFRICSLIMQNRFVVFNATRDGIENGSYVQVMRVENHSDILQEPITVKDNKALVSGARVGLFRAGQKIGDGEIVSVSNSIDLDTGMHIIKTKNVADGLQYAEYRRNGYFIPVYAIVDNSVFVYENNKAVRKNIIIARQDADTALITQGLSDGDIVILSKVSDGDKVQIKENK